MYIRKWLNKKGRAFIEVEFSEFGDGGSVTIHDCNKQISLDFFVYEKKEFKSKIAKLDILIESLVRLRNHIEDKMIKSEKKSSE